MIKQAYSLLFMFILLLTSFTPIKAQNLAVQNAFPNLKFDSPVDLQYSSPDSDELFLVEKTGRIFVFANRSNATSPKLFLDLSDEVLHQGECGLLGLAFHPNYKNNRTFFVNYTTKKNLHTIVGSFQTDPNDPHRAIPETFIKFLEIKQPFSNHNGGQIVFGPDGFLYIGMGDGGSGGDPKGNGQNKTVLLGKMLRIDVNKKSNGLPYSIPNSNPFFGNKEGYCPEIYAYGLRNPWRFSFDSKTKKLWCADVGQNKWEEIDIIELGGNYGWNLKEASYNFKPDPNIKERLLDPIYEYAHEKGNCSITGGFVYHGKQKSDLENFYIYADYCSKKIWKLHATSYENKLIGNLPAPINSFGLDPQGELYILGGDGIIYEFAPNIKEPTDLQLQANTFTWKDNSDNEANFIIEKKNAQGKYEVVATIPANTTSYKSTANVTKGIYRIYAKSAKETSKYTFLPN